MILIRILIAGCAILLIGIGIGMALRARRTDQENKEMEAILKKYGKGKTDSPGSGDAGDGGGDIPHRL
jgi:hypothetical protein